MLKRKPKRKRVGKIQIVKEKKRLESIYGKSENFLHKEIRP